MTQTTFGTALAALALVFAANAANAATQTVTFDGGECGTASPSRSEGPISFGRSNWSLYDYCEDNILIGDDGWFNDDFVEIDPGYEFDILGFDLSASYSLGRVRGSFANESLASDAFFAGEYDVVDSYDFMTIDGYRDGDLSATISFDPQLTTSPDFSAFTGLDRVEFSVMAYGFGIPASTFLFPDGQWYGCADGNGRCGQAVYDNLRLEVRSLTPDVAPVPLPAGGLLLLAALGGLTAVRRRRA